MDIVFKIKKKRIMSKSKKGGDEVVINMDSWGVPIAIVISGIIIAAVIFFASRSNNAANNVGEVNDNVGADTQEVAQEGSATLGDDPYLGDLDTATVAIVEFSDYMCGFCQRHGQETFPSIKENYIDTGKVVYVFKEFPLSAPGQAGYNIAEGGACLFSLSDSETFLEYHKNAFFLETNDDIVSLAVDLGVNEGRFRSCLENGDFRDEVGVDLEEGKGAGITGTPGFVVGLIGEDGLVEGELIFGAYPYETFVEAIEGLL